VHDIEATITFLGTEQGGRHKPCFSGYRPQFRYDDRDWDTQHEYPDQPIVQPGQTVRALIQFLTPENHRGKIQPGMVFEIREGSRVVARGTVTKLLALV
jgi:translation elongation factor EF-Tu-like GTPase